jgi:hypothetical protein
MVHSLAVYDVVADILRSRATTARGRGVAFGAPPDVWRRVLAFEGCAVQFERALQGAGLIREAPVHLRRFLLDETGTSLRHAVVIHHQLVAIGELAARHGIRVLVLKGAGRVLGGGMGGTRSIADIDLLVAASDAGRLHRLLQTECGYAASAPAQRHHLAPLSRARCLTVEIHVRLTGDELTLDAEIWRDTRQASAGPAALEIPSPTNMLLHTLEHATTLNWMSRYRLRDILDVACCFTADVSTDLVDAYVRRSPGRAALETILSAARELEPRIAQWRSNAWVTVRRVSRARLALAASSGDPVIAERIFRYAGVIAEGSPRTIARAALTGSRWLRATAAALIGT